MPTPFLNLQHESPTSFGPSIPRESIIGSTPPNPLGLIVSTLMIPLLTFILYLISLVDDLVAKYKRGKILETECPQCGYGLSIKTSGVHETEGGSLQVYSEDDELCCPSCGFVESKGKCVVKTH